MSSKINIISIIVDHVNTLRNFDKYLKYQKNPEKMHKYQVYSKIDLFVFFGLPLIISASLGYINIILNDNTLGVIITSLTIFSALLFNLLLIIYDVTQKPTTNQVKKVFLEELYSNISFCILVAIITTIFAVTAIILKIPIVYTIASLIIYYFFTIFMLTLLMILKRAQSLLTQEN